jgi:uncharacterized protein (TIRG00374 family)
MIQSSNVKRILLLSLRFAVAGALLIWIYVSIGSDALLQAWELIDMELFFLAILIQTLSYMLGSFRWWLLLRGAGIRIPFLETLSLYYLGLFFNQFLPTGIGGDAVRVYKLYQRGHAGAPSVASTMMDRLVGLLSLLILTSLAVLLPNAQIVLATVGFLVSISLAAAAIGTFLFLFLPLPQRAIDLASRINEHSIAGRFLKVFHACRSYKGSFHLLITALLLSFILQSMAVLVYAILARALDMDIQLSVLFFAVPLVFVATVLPFTLGGLGIREGTLIAVLGLMGVGMIASGQLAVVYLIALWLSIIPGGWSLLFGKQTWALGRKFPVNSSVK